MPPAPKKPSFLVDARWLAKHRRSAGVVLIDTRTADDYWKGHLRGSRHFDPFPFHHADTSERGMSEFRAQLRWIFSALGLTGRETAVVCYENDSGMRATRVAWALEFMGHPRARILDGGLKAASGEKLVRDAPRFAPANFKERPRDSAAASCLYILERLGGRNAQLLDVRTDEEYFGERVRARFGGAIPGAIHHEWVNALAPSGEFRPAAELRAEFEALGLDPSREIITYCQGGYRSAHSYYALKLAGFDHVRNYYGSWAEWGNREDVPIERPRRRAAAA
jgi:thiosulfate/3-mercaptopyruvate sulfurtransferase